MTIQKTIFIAIIGLFLTVAAHPLSAAKSIVQEETARFESDTVRYPAAHTFIITPGTAKREKTCIGINAKESGVTDRCQLPTIHFQLGSARLSSGEKQSLLDGLQRCAVSETTPLRVTGYTCPLGNEQGNRMLSLHRAWEVADFLLKRGYTVKVDDVKGRGKEDPLTDDPKELAINRRVQIAM